LRKITKEYTIYKFDELDENTQNSVVSNYIQNWLYSVDYEKLNKNSNLYKAIKKAEDLQTPWFTINYVYDYCEKEILRNVKKEEYYENGNLYFGD
jgi:hypothetical protein